MLRRSGNAAPLDVRLLPAAPPEEVELLRFIHRLVSDHHHQLSRLSLSLGSQQAAITVDLLSRSFNVLTFLNLSVTGSSTMLPDNFLGMDPVPLRHLRLHNCYIPWKSLGLKAPRLTDIELYARHTTDVNDFCHALASMPELISLKLVQIDEPCLSFNSSTSSVGQNVSPMSLPRLETLWLLPMESSVVIRFLQRLHLPALEELKLRCTFHTPHNTSLNRLFDCLTPFNETILGSSAAINRLEISAGIQYPWSEWTCIPPEATWVNSSRRITLGFLPALAIPDFTHRLISILCSRFTFPQVEELSLSLFDVEDLEDESWFSILRSMRQVKTLRITGELPEFRTLLKMLVKYDDDLFLDVRAIKYRFKEVAAYPDGSDLDHKESLQDSRELFSMCLPLLLERCVFPGSSLRFFELEPVERVQGGRDVDWNSMFAQVYASSLVSHFISQSRQLILCTLISGL